MKNLHKNYVFDFILAALLLALGIVLLPPFGIGQRVLDIFVAIGLLAYLALYLFGRLRRTRGTSLVLTAIEFFVILLIAVGLVLKQLQIFSLGETCQILGVVIWLRGIVSLLSHYFTSYQTQRKKRSLLFFLLYLVLVTLGTYLFAKPLFTNETVLWILSIALIVAALCFVALAILYLPARGKKGSGATRKSKSSSAKKKS